MADALATPAGAFLGTYTTTTYVESASGVAQGGRTGLTAFTIACCGKFKKLTPTMYILAVLFILKFIFI